MRPFLHLRIIPLGLFILVSSINAQTIETIKPFTSDGCSSFPDGTLAQKKLWLKCCVEHDKSYWQGGTKQQRLDADIQLKQCVESVGKPRIAELMLAGVRVGGSPYWPTKFRWGYGWDYPKGYAELSNQEKEQASKAWQNYLKSLTKNSKE